MAQRENEGFMSKYDDLYGRRKGVRGKLFRDLFAAAVAATLVAPSVTLIDRQVLRQHFELRWTQPLGLAALERPGTLFLARPFTSVWTLYAATYAMANSADTVMRDFGLAAAGTVTFISTLAVNIPLGIRKDLRFAQCYGSAAELAAKSTIKQGTRRPAIPKAAMPTFLIRDTLAIFGSFVVPPRVASAIPDELAGPHAKATLTQMTVPVVSQMVATPVRLLSLSLYD
ncbi:uncharacterized protein BKCO1_500037 [Diplodia corticola]|uniref:Sequence orphan n=1 Tax=Diplodia corticola TaxID=236234 RepID=A0A1J9SC52_9PEZI|nr:uncharacterized protein BKCO1_500037 [Diplodia corticola]OJD38039.1 sequence orphan [Diplodia corticola]